MHRFGLLLPVPAKKLVVKIGFFHQILAGKIIAKIIYVCGAWC